MFQVILLQAEGGSKTYLYNVSDPEFGTVDNEGKVTTHTGPGEFKVKAYMPKTPGNFVESKVYITTIVIVFDIYIYISCRMYV